MKLLHYPLIIKQRVLFKVTNQVTVKSNAFASLWREKSSNHLFGQSLIRLVGAFKIPPETRNQLGSGFEPSPIIFSLA